MPAGEVVAALVSAASLGCAAVVQLDGAGWTIVAAHDEIGAGLVRGDRLVFGQDRWADTLLASLAPESELPAPLRDGLKRQRAAHDPQLVCAPITVEDGLLVGAVLAIAGDRGTDDPVLSLLLGAFARLLGIIYGDLWDRRELEAEHDDLEARTASHQRLLAEVGHDFRAPLSVIAGMAEVIDRYPDARDRVLLAARSIGANARRLTAMVDGLLDAGARDLSTIEEEPETVDLWILAEEVAVEAQHLTTSPDVSIEHQGRGRLFAPPITTRRLLTNLVVNAVRNTRAGTVRIRADETDQGAVLTVQDTGRGMADADVERFTEAYVRGEDSSGFGLGLSIVQRLARALQAEIEVSSTRGEGTTFRVHVPHALTG